MKQSSPARRAAALAAAAGVLAGTLLYATPATAIGGDRRCVQWSKVFVRNYPAGQAWDQLQHNETFSVYEYRDSGWARGFAWGDLNTDQSPYAPPHDNVWVETASLGHHVNDGSSCP
jgi:hypothetical protein